VSARSSACTDVLSVAPVSVLGTGDVIVDRPAAGSAERPDLNGGTGLPAGWLANGHQAAHLASPWGVAGVRTKALSRVP
jgi:hypothetical protein